MRWGWVFLGRVAYLQALDVQQKHAERVRQGLAGPVLFLLEHPPTVTLGRMARTENLLLEPQQYRARAIEVVRVKRGGDVTVHAPGQLVGYPVADIGSLKVSVPEWVRGHALALQRVLRCYGISARWSDLHPGLWVGRKKIAALGFQLTRRVSTHGFALNVDMDLTFFDTIVPCGLRHLGVTSMAREGVQAEMKKLAAEVAAEVAHGFGATELIRLEPQSFLAPVPVEEAEVASPRKGRG